MNRLLLIASVLAISPGCISIGYHSRKVAEVRQEDYEYARDLALKVQNGDMRARDMVSRLRWRYRQQVEAQ